MNKYLGIAGLACVAIAGVCIWLYGNARHDVGLAECKAKNVVVAVEESQKSAKKLEKINNETRKMSPSAIDADLIKLGVMREYQDR